jgi:diketogulonate reductase-like aldo/keto reductase
MAARLAHAVAGFLWPVIRPRSLTSDFRHLDWPAVDFNLAGAKKSDHPLIGCASSVHCCRRDRSVKTEPKNLLNRRKFNALCAAASGSVSGSVGGFVSGFVMAPRAFAANSAAGAPGEATRTVKLRDGAVVPALGQGSARLGKGRHPQSEEEEALRTGLSLGMTLIDTAELYGSEDLIGRVIAGQRERVFLVSKVWPNHVAGNGIARACEASLKRLGTDHLDLYLLHWPTGISDFGHVVRGFEELRASGKIRAWGVSNFKTSDMEKLFKLPQGDRCAMNQVSYSLDDRGVERDLLPWCERHAVAVMAYSPLGGPGANLLHNAALSRVGAAHGASPAAVALAWTMRRGNVVAIPESGSVAHVRENAAALTLPLTPQDLADLDAAFPPRH